MKKPGFFTNFLMSNALKKKLHREVFNFYLLN